MAYTEKVLLSGTALSFLMYECVNSTNSQEGFLIGEVTSEVTNHISDSQSDNTRLDTQIVIRSALPLPSVSLFYLPTGKIKEDALNEVLSSSASEIVGWYKYRKNTNIRPTFRDKLLAKGLQKYFEKHHGKKTFVTCNLSNRSSTTGSTHTFTYRFGKMNCLDMYEYIEDVTANLGEKFNGYRKGLRHSHHTIFNKIIKESNIQNNNTNDAILSIQEAVNVRLVKEAQLAAKNESTIKELEAEIRQMSSILSDKLSTELQTTYDQIRKENCMNREVEMAEACIEAMKSPPTVNLNSFNMNHQADGDGVFIIDNDENDSDSSPILMIPSPRSVSPRPGSPRPGSPRPGSPRPGSPRPGSPRPVSPRPVSPRPVSPRPVSPRPVSPRPVSPRPVSPKPVLNYAAALKNKDGASTSKSTNHDDDLITFDDEETHTKKTIEKSKASGDSSPEY